jgi:hypothetical protein
MWIAISQDYVIQEYHCGVSITLVYWLHLNPLGELVHHHQDMCHFASCRIKRAYMSKPQTAKGYVNGIVLSADAG